MLGMLGINQTLSGVEAVGNVFDKLFTSDEERAKAEAVLKKIQQKPSILQAELNKIEATHRSLFVAGWRPFIGWICGVNLAYLVIIRDWLAWFFAAYAPDLPPPPALGADMTMELVTALLGLGTLRTWEKMKGRAK